MEGCINTCNLAPRRTWKDKLRMKLFPPEHCMLPDAPVTHKDCITHRVYIQLDFIDILRILFSGRLVCDSKIVTEHVVGDNRGC